MGGGGPPSRELGKCPRLDSPTIYVYIYPRASGLNLNRLNRAPVELAATKNLVWKEDPGDEVSVSLRLGHDSSNELRVMGGLLSVAWRATSEAITNIATDLDTSHHLLTDRKSGKLMIVHRKRLLCFCSR